MKKARLFIDKAYKVSEVDPHIYASFIENAVGIVPNGLYNPNHPQADEKGFRKDVIQIIRELNTPSIRFPGGNYVSNYDWKDGIGPREKRPVRNNIVHGGIDENLVGIDDWVDYSERTGTEFMIALNMGTGTLKDALEEIEYCNVEKGTYWSDLRRQNGYEKPHKLKYWYIGNEMDGEWQVGHLNAEEYARKATEVAKVMKMTDPSVELIVCGTSASENATYPDWDRIVLEETYPYVDMISIHKYYFYGRTLDGYAFGTQYSVEDLAHAPKDLEKYLRTIESTIDYVKARLRTEKDIYISVDEWGLNSSTDVTTHDDLQWTEKVYPVNKENIYPFGNLIDALIYGIFLIAFINHADRVKHACRSLLHYTTMTADPEGIALRHTPYYVMQQMAKYGRGTALRNVLQSPDTKTDNYGDCPSVVTAATFNEEDSTLNIFAVNLDLREDIELDLQAAGFGDMELIEHMVMYDDQPLAGNTFEQPERIVPQDVQIAQTPILRKHSWNMLRYKVK